MHVMLLLLTKRMSQLGKNMSGIIDFLELTSKLYKCKFGKTMVYYELLRMPYIATVIKFVQQIYGRTRRPFNKPNSSSTLCMPIIYRYIKTESESTKVTLTYNRSSFKIRQGSTSFNRFDIHIAKSSSKSMLPNFQSDPVK